MISGKVDLLRLPVINIEVCDKDGQTRTAEANLDTGFTGELTLPKAAIEQLDLPQVGTANMKIGTGANTRFNAYRTTIIWHDLSKEITVLEAEIWPVVGVGLLWQNNLSIDFTDGGDVTITEL